MKIKFSKEDKPKLPEIPREYVTSSKRSVKVGYGNKQPLPPEPCEDDLEALEEELIPPKPPKPEVSPPPPISNNPLSEEIEYFKRNYGSVFGMDSLIPASKDIIMLNLLFAIYSELVNLRAEINKND